MWSPEVTGASSERWSSLEAREEKKDPKESARREQIRRHLEKWQKNTATAAELDVFQSSVTHTRDTLVTLQDVKMAAVCLLQQNEGYPIPRRLLALLKAALRLVFCPNIHRSSELDGLLADLLLYFSCFFEKNALEKRPKSLMGEAGGGERRAAERLDLALRRLGLSYSRLLLGEAPGPPRLMACNRFKVSSTHSDIQLNECFYCVCCYAVWVTFERRGLRAIRVEIGRLFRSDSFNPALNEADGQSEEAEPRRTALSDRKCGRRPALSRLLTQCSPLMASLLPTPQESAPHLFGGIRRAKAPSGERGHSEAEMQQRLDSLSFGILGKPLSQFSPKTLKPQDGPSEEEEDEGTGGDLVNPDPHIRSKRTSVRGQRSLSTAADGRSRSRRVDLASRATTEAVSSDTE